MTEKSMVYPASILFLLISFSSNALGSTNCNPPESPHLYIDGASSNLNTKVSTSPIPSFYLSFNSIKTARTPNGYINGQVIGSPSLVSGKVGTGLLVESSADQLQFPTQCNLSPEKGSISVWVKPLDWDGGAENFHTFFEARGEGALFLYKYSGQNRLIFATTKNASTGPFSVVEQKDKIVTGEWVHLAATWSKRDLSLYINGILSQRSNLPDLPQKLREYFTVGDLSWASTRKGKSIIDELVIYKDVLSDQQIVELHSGKNPYQLSQNTQTMVAYDESSYYRVGRKPISPWSNLVVDKNVVFLKNKKIVLNELALPEQLIVNGNEILNLPLSFEFFGGKLVLDKARSIQTNTSDAGDRVEYDVPLSTNLVSGKLDVNLHVAIEYDGLIEINLSSNNFPEELIGQKLTYSLNVKAGVAKFVHKFGRLGERNLDLSLAKKENLISFKPYIWIGNDSNGLFWLSESSKGWGNADKNDVNSPIKLRKSANEWHLDFEIAALPDSNGHWTHSFGLMTTPVKKLPSDWRKWSLGVGGGNKIQVIWPNVNDGNFKHFGYPAANDEIGFANYLDALEGYGIAPVPYVNPTWIDTAAAEWTENGKDWNSQVKDNGFKGFNGISSDFVFVCPNNYEWSNFVKKKVVPFIERYRLKGLYMDNAQLYRTKNCLDKSKLSSVTEYPSLYQRDLYLDVMNATRKQGDGISIVHSSGGINAFSFSSVDAWVNGEQYRGVVKEDYLDVASLLDFRIELNGPQWGFIPIFLPEFNDSAAKKIGPTKKLMTIMLLHDVIIWPLWSNKDVIESAMNTMNEFDVVGAEFTPYYSDENPVSSQDFLVSSYLKDGFRLLIVGNLKKDRIQGKVCFRSQGKASSVKYVGLSEKILFDGNCLIASISPGEYKLISYKED